ncbi:MAG: hypothetical protein JSS55_15565 [Proteobacteria bacterium]|nr:hypothetical protein [Pseudomonadota bacterium]
MPAGLHLILYTAAAFLLLTEGGNIFCRWVLFFAGMRDLPSPDPVSPAAAGRIIGSLERLIVAIGLAAGSWEVVAAVVALKTVARFKELDDKRFAEYFLIGSLCSLLWAAAVTGVWIGYDSWAGVKARGTLAAVMTPPVAKKD